jgi:hypothetical protein
MVDRSAADPQDGAGYPVALQHRNGALASAGLIGTREHLLHCGLQRELRRVAGRDEQEGAPGTRAVLRCRRTPDLSRSTWHRRRRSRLRPCRDRWQRSTDVPGVRSAKSMAERNASSAASTSQTMAAGSFWWLAWSIRAASICTTNPLSAPSRIASPWRRQVGEGRRIGGLVPAIDFVGKVARREGPDHSRRVRAREVSGGAEHFVAGCAELREQIASV